MPTLIACLDRSMRAFGGTPTYWLTDNERTVTMDDVAAESDAVPGQSKWLQTMWLRGEFYFRGEDDW